MSEMTVFSMRNGLASVFMLVFAAGVGAILSSAVYAKTRPQLSQWMRRTVLVLLPTYILLMMSTGLWCDHILKREFFKSLSSDLPSIRLMLNGRTVIVQGRDEIHRLRLSIQDASEVSAHHSSPEEQMQFTLDDPGEIYSLGKDSKVHQEFWIVLEKSKRYPVMEAQITHIASPSLGAWLDQVRSH
jgi:hypothetical protein